MPIAIEWGGKKLTIADSEAFEVGAAVEEIITLPELAQIEVKPKTFKLAAAYTEMINFAGGNAKREDVHKAMMKEMASGKATAAQAATSHLISLIMDGAMSESEGGEPVAEK